MRTLCCAFIHRFGGLVPFAAWWITSIQGACETEQGSPRVLKSFEAFICLNEFAEKLEDTVGDEFDTSAMTIEQMELELGRMIRDDFERQPEIVVDAVREGGWTVIPPPRSRQTMSTERRFCTACCESHPVDQFRKRRRGGIALHSECNGCRNFKDRERRSRKKDTGIHRFNSKILQAKIDREIRTVCCMIICGFGGLGAFATKWAEAIHYAPQTAHVSRRLMQAYWTVTRIMSFVAQRKDEDDDPDDYGGTHEERQRDADRVHLERIEQNLDVALDALREGGWTVNPPKEPESGRTAAVKRFLEEDASDR